jgi:acyl-homoserine lactone acylase PvdQ
MFSHGRSPYVAWGVTAINPDVSDVYIEELREGNQYRTTKDKWADLKIVKDTIKVRFGSPYEFEIKKTENGVLIPNDLLDGSAGSLIPWIDNYVLHGD